MKRTSRIYSKIWFSSTFLRLSEDAKFLFLYLLTCPWGNSLGLFVLKLGYALADLLWDEARFRKAMNELQEVTVWGGHRGLVKWDEKVNLVWIRNYLEHNPLYNPNQVKGALKILRELPKSPLLIEFAEYLENHLDDEKRLERYSPLIEWVKERRELILSYYESLGEGEPSFPVSVENFSSLSHTHAEERPRIGRPRIGSEENVDAEVKAKNEKRTDPEQKNDAAEEKPARQNLLLDIEPKTKSEKKEKTAESREKRNGNQDIPKCPYRDILETFNVVLGNDLQPVDLNLPISSSRRRRIKALWRKLFTKDKDSKYPLLSIFVELNGSPPTANEGIFWFRKYFEYIRESDFLCGRVKRGAGDPWRASFDWLLTWEKVQKVLEGTYHNDGKKKEDPRVIALANMFRTEQKGEKVRTFIDDLKEKVKEIEKELKKEKQAKQGYPFTGEGEIRQEVSDTTKQDTTE